MLDWDSLCKERHQTMKRLEMENNRLFIETYRLQEEFEPTVPDDEITLYRPDREEDIKRLVSYSIGCVMGRYSLDKPGLIYAHSGNEGFDPTQYATFRADDDGIIHCLNRTGVFVTTQPIVSLSSLVLHGRRNTWMRI